LTEGIALLKVLSLGEKSISEGKGIPAKKAFARIRARIKGVKTNGEGYALNQK
jgi:hypothetical protein